MFLFSSSGEIYKEISNPYSTDSTAMQTVVNIFWDAISKSLIALFAIFLYLTGCVWNIVISFMRGATQGDHSLGIWVTVAWLSSFFLPVAGLIVSCVIQVWAWFRGSKELSKDGIIVL